jgi:hypothetical protein
MKKAKGKSKAKGSDKKQTTGRTKKTGGTKNKKKVDMGKVRAKLTNMVGGSAEVIAQKVIAAAKDGQLPQAKYLFEMAGLYPATETSNEGTEEDSLESTLMTRLGLNARPRTTSNEDSEESDNAQGENATGACGGEPGAAEEENQKA